MAWLAVVTVACVVLAIILVAVRMYTRGFVTRSLGIDDALLVASLAGAINHEVGTMFQFSSGLGNPSASKTALAKWQFVTFVASQVTHGLLNISVVHQYRRRFTSRLADRVSMVLAVWFAFWAAFSIVFGPFICVPTQEFWNDLHDQHGCVSRANMQLFVATFSLTHGILLWSFPLPFLLTEFRPMGTGEMIGLAVAMVLGLGAVLCSGMRVYVYIMSIGLTYATTIGSTYGVTATIADSLEISLAIIAVSLVTLEPLRLVLAEWLARLRNIPGAGPSGPHRGSGSIVNPQSDAQSGESHLLEDYPQRGRRPRTSASAQTRASGSQFSHALPLDMPMPRLPQPRSALMRSSSRSGSAPGPSSIPARRRSDAGGPSVAASTFAETRYSGPGVLVTTTFAVTRSTFVDIRIDLDDDVTPAFPGTITTCTATKGLR
ncbi:hypothetical protein V8F20_007283 [Naviculisporaceae sp. PSN 640]